MATYSGLPAVRDDFRCSLCRQKNAFHCEHDTPYRDHILGTYNYGKPMLASSSSSSSRKRSHRTTNSQNDNPSNQHVNYGNNANTNAAGARYQHGKRPENTSVLNTNNNLNSNNYTRIQGQQKKNKSCTIL